jgi:PAS domain S-box-containing protein
VRANGIFTRRAAVDAAYDVGAMPAPLQDVDLWLVDSLMIPASLHDVDGHFVRVNEAAERASGRSNAEWFGRHFTEPLPPEARKSVAAHFRRAVERGEPADFETVFIDAGGHLRGVRAQHLPLRSNGAIVGVLILAFDAVRAYRPRASGATDAPPTRDPRPDRLRPIDIRDRDAAVHLARNGPQPLAEPLCGTARAHAARGDRGGSAARAACSAGARPATA